MARMMITLTVEETRALCKLAQRELRNPRDQIRLIVREELLRLGLLKHGEAEDERDG